VSGELLALANKEVDRAYSLYDRCTTSGEWPGYSEAPGSVTVLADLPGSKSASKANNGGISF